MSGITVPYVVMPCIGAVVLGAMVRDWRLAAAALFGALAVLAANEYLPDPVRVFGLPVIMGIILGSVALVPYLAIRPVADVWGRMLCALIPTFVIGFLFLLISTSGP